MFSKTNDKSYLFDLACLALLFCVFYFFMLGHYPLFVPDEGRYGEAAREMLISHDYITPRVNGVAFLDKPILYYWLETISLSIFGITEWAVRFMPTLMGILGCLLTYLCGRQLFNRRAAIFAATILATSPLYFAGAHYANLDLEVAVWIGASLMLFLTALQCHRPTYFYAAYLCGAGAFLTKGLMGLVFPAMIIGTWVLLQWRFDLLRKMRLVSGLTLFIAIILPWYILVQRANPEFLHYFFVTQQVTRFLSGAAFNNVYPFWFYLPVLCAGFLPWTLFLIPSFYHYARMVWQAPKANPQELFLLLWIVLVFGFFSIPHSKIVTYILPIFPAMALLIGHYLDQYWERAQETLTFYFITSTVLSTLFLLTLTFNAAHLNRGSTKHLDLELNTLLQSQDEVIGYHLFNQDIPFYLGRRISLVADWQSATIVKNDNWMRELWFGMPFQDTKDWLIDETTFWQRWHSTKQIYAFVGKHYFQQFEQLAKHFYFVSQDGNMTVFSNHPIQKPIAYYK